MNLRKLFLSALILTSAVTTKAEWTDVTNIFLSNPNFDNNQSTGWYWHSDAGSQTANYGCFEFWNGYFNFFQEIQDLPKGNYRLTFQGYYRCSDFDVCYNDHVNGTEDITAYVFAGETVKQVESVFSFAFDRSVRGAWSPDGRHYYPNNMETAAVAFAEGAYQNTLEFSSDGGYMEIGLRCFEYLPSNWCIFDNFKLEYDGQIVLASGIDVTAERTEIKEGERTYCVATVLPENAASKEVKWTSSNPEVALVDEYGMVYGNGVGKALITATTTDGSNLSASVEITVKEDDTKWVDVTNIFLTNPSFDNNTADGWEYYSNASSQMGNFGCFEFWNGSFGIYQILDGMPAGKYRVSVQAYYRTGDNGPAYDAFINGTEVIQVSLIGNSIAKPIASIYSCPFDDYNSNDVWSPNWNGGPWFPNGMSAAAEAFQRGAYNNSLIFEHDNSEYTMAIGLECNAYNYSNWCCFDNFRLEYGGEFIQAKSITATIDKADIIVSEKTQCHATITPENAMFKNVTWESRDEKVATIDQDGIVTGVGVGSTLLVATTTDGTNLKAGVTVNVRDGASADDIVINEVMAANVDEFISPAFNFDGWIEIYNPTNAAVKLGGLYLSDEEGDLTKWQIPTGVGVVPQKGFKTLWFDSNNVNQDNAPFKLDVDGGEVFISDGKKVIASVQYPEAMERVSYARTTDGGEQWGFAANATPGKSNATSSFADAQIDAPVVDLPSQLFTTPLSVNVGIPEGTTLRYTTDGTLPTMDNGLTSTTGQFSVTETQTLRFRLFADDMLPSRVTSRSYIYSDRDYMLPVVAVVSDPRFLYDDSIGVYVRGRNGRPGNGQSGKCNWNMDWDRPVNFSYLDAEGEMVLNQDVNLEMCGGWSRAWNPHAFKLKGDKELGGNKNLNYQFFDDKPYIRNRTLQVRNGGNDNVCRFLDPALQYIMQSSGIDIDVQSYQPVHEFINGQYIGVLNVREPNNKHYVYANYGWDDDEIDQFEMSPDSGYVQKCGTEESFLELVDQLSPNAANSEVYKEIKRMLDIDEYIYYMAAQFYLGNWDWPQNNVKGFKYKDGGKYRFVCFDLDGAFKTSDPFQGFMNKEWYTFDQLYPVTLGRISGPIRFVTLFRNLLDNDDFKRKFIDAFCIMGGSVFEANRAIGVINQLAERVNPAMRLEGLTVDNTANSLKNNLRGRNEASINALRGYWPFELSGTEVQRVTLQSDTEGAGIFINDIKVPTGYFNGTLFQPVTLIAQAPAGHVFLGWANGGGMEKELLGRGAVWKYYDQGSLDNANWTSPTYNESGWKSGNAPLGYEKNGIATTLDYGNDGNNKRPTAYFRASMRLDKTPKSTDKFTLNFTIDDGFIVYVNGAEAGRYNMPSGRVRYNTFAASYAPSNPDNGTMALAPELFHSGDNIIAVEVHNNSASSTDLYWDADITTTVMGGVTEYYSTDARIPLPEGNVSLTACYREMTEAEKAEAGLHPVCVNEVSASNNAYVNEYGKKNDWVELYNTTNEDIDIEGMYLTDNLDNKTKYIISKEGTRASTIIPAHGHLVIWCDKLQTTDKALHATFKLAGEGGVVALTAADKSWTDVLQYAAHDGNSTVGRYPDGAQQVYLMNVPTIEKTNTLSSYAVNVPQDGEVGIQSPLITAANGMRIYYAAQAINVKAEGAKWARVSIYSTDGRMVDRQTAHFNHGVARIDVTHLSQGFYIARAEDGQGTKVACKFAR